MNQLTYNSVRYEDIELLAKNCTEVLVWKIRGDDVQQKRLQFQSTEVDNLNVVKLLSVLNSQGIVTKEKNNTKTDTQNLFICLENECEQIS